MADKPVPLTKEGLNKLQQELERLMTAERPRVARLIQEARELAGAQNTSEYEDAKNEQAHVEGRILQLQALIQNAVIIEAHDSQRVGLGSTVTVLNEKGEQAKYTIVGSAEADPKNGRISNESPVGQALLDKTVGDQVQIQAPAGLLLWTITRIS
ncbi:MAG: transcription elongation factor GreA [Dehalococcoidia bacterium]